MKTPKYSFTKGITEELETLKQWMLDRQYHPNTARQTRNYTGIYLKWLECQGLELEQANYKEILAFVADLQAENESSQFINKILRAVDHYIRFKELDNNPVGEIRLKGRMQTIPTGLVEFTQLEELYHNYLAVDDLTKRNKVMLGMMIYQAVSTKDLHRLEVQQIKLRQGKIHVPAGTQLRSRVLDIQAAQFYELHEYIKEVRPRMQTSVEDFRRMRKGTWEIDTEAVKDQLFFSRGGKACIKMSLHRMFAGIKKRYPEIKNTQIIRHSVITEWLKTRGIREVQYMAGYRCVGSAQRYKDFNMEELSKALNEYHPLK